MGTKNQWLIIGTLFVFLLVCLTVQTRKTHHLQLVNAALQETISKLECLQDAKPPPSSAQGNDGHEGKLNAKLAETRREIDNSRAIQQKPPNVLDVPAASGQSSRGASDLGQQTNVVFITYTAQNEAILKWNDTLISGGWSIHPGKRAFVTIHPSWSPEGRTLACNMFEVDEPAIPQLNLNFILPNGLETSAQSIIPLSERDSFFFKLHTFLVYPGKCSTKVAVVEGHLEMKAVEIRSSPSGEPYSLGPVFDIVAHVTKDDRIELSAKVSINVPAFPMP